jgi:hypothetical protein
MRRRIPKYSTHKATGQARVRIDGRTFYLGKYDSPESHRKYDEIIATWLTGDGLPNPDAMTVSRLCVTYIEKHAKLYYRKNGRETSELSVIRAALKPLIQQFGQLKVEDFGPGKLKRVRQSMIERGLVRASINQNINRIRRLFKWGVENELVPVNVHVALTTVAGLRHGRSEAVESDPVVPGPGRRHRRPGVVSWPSRLGDDSTPAAHRDASGRSTNTLPGRRGHDDLAVGVPSCRT